ncbi:MAG: tetratricopeptide repeat protein [Luteolibacter sp.]
MPRPTILISAVNRELQSTRFVVANSLIALGCEPIWQDLSTTEETDQKAEICKNVDRSDAVLQIVGHHHGTKLVDPDDEIGSVSHTQYEALYAHKLGKPVWYILLDNSYPTDCENDESEQLRKIQLDYRIQVANQHGHYHRSFTSSETKEIVLNLRKDLFNLHPPFLKRRSVSIALILLIISSIIWFFLRQDNTNEKPAVASQTITEEIIEKQDTYPLTPSSTLKPVEKVLLNLVSAENRSRIPGESLTLEELRNRAYTLLEAEFELTPNTLATSLPTLALELYESPDTELILKASAAYALNKFEEAEKLFLEQESKGEAAMENTGNDTAGLRTQRILALEGAAQLATAQIQFTRAVEHYRAAAALTSLDRDPLEWARIRHMLAYSLTYNGKYSEVADTLQEVIPVYKKHLGEEHPDTLRSSNNLANALNSLGKHSEAEQQHRDILAIRERVLGADHPRTLTSRSNLAATLNSQGKHEQAEAQHRTALTIRERVLGADHPDTSFSRNNLGIALEAQGKYAEAEEQYRTLLEVHIRILGEEHSDTLSTRNHLAKVLRSQKKYADAEQQSRAVLAIHERLLGVEHYDVFLSCHNLALSLAKQKKYTEALIYAKRSRRGFTKTLGLDHPYSKAALKLCTLLESHQPPSGE